MVQPRARRPHALELPRRLNGLGWTLTTILADADLDIIDVDRRPIAFAEIQDFERLLSQANEACVRGAIAADHEDRFLGWLLPAVEQELNGPPKARKGYPFRADYLLPWRSRFRSGDDDDEADDE